VLCDLILRIFILASKEHLKKKIDHRIQGYLPDKYGIKISL
jgi:hypothetical protein